MKYHDNDLLGQSFIEKDKRARCRDGNFLLALLAETLNTKVNS